MATRTARRGTGRNARSAGRRAANSSALRWLARAGFAARGVIYIIVASGVLKYVLGTGGPQSSDKQSVDLTATLLKYPAARSSWS